MKNKKDRWYIGQVVFFRCLNPAIGLVKRQSDNYEWVDVQWLGYKKAKRHRKMDIEPINGVLNYWYAKKKYGVREESNLCEYENAYESFCSGYEEAYKKVLKLKQLMLLTDKVVSNVEVNEIALKQWSEFVREFPEESQEKDTLVRKRSFLRNEAK